MTDYNLAQTPPNRTNNPGRLSQISRRTMSDRLFFHGFLFFHAWQMSQS